MLINSRFPSLGQALDSKKMARIFQKHLPGFYGHQVQVKSCVAGQIFPKEEETRIKYFLRIKNGQNLPGEKLILFGQLFLNGNGKQLGSELEEAGIIKCLRVNP